MEERYRPRPNDHLVEPMFEALRESDVGSDGVEPDAVNTAAVERRGRERRPGALPLGAMCAGAAVGLLFAALAPADSFAGGWRWVIGGALGLGFGLGAGAMALAARARR